MKLVLDTHVWLDWLVFDEPAVRPIRDAVQSGRAEIVIDAACQAELQRVLAYDLGRHSVSAELQVAALGVARGLARLVEVPAPENLPRCKDPDDQKFIALAYAANADALVTKDRALLEMRRRVPFLITRPEAAIKPPGTEAPPR